jgi:light-independent protochlorophyllide reductase subunit B
MQLTLWTYEGPPHVGAMRVATAMTDVHYVLHAPQGDTYADLLFTMIERRSKRPPVTYTTFQARDLGGDTAELFKTAARDAYARFQPQALLVGSSCTAELIQDDPGGLALALDLPVPVVPLELPAYQRKENWGASETFYQLVRHLAGKPRTAAERQGKGPIAGRRATCNLLGPTALGFRHRDDVTEITGLLARLGVDVNVCAPLNASVADLQRLPQADFNVVLYPEVGALAAQWLQRVHGMPMVKTVPLGVGATREFVREVAALAGTAENQVQAVLDDATARSPWYSRSVDSTYLTGKRVFVFGDATHVVAAARIAAQELGFEVVGLGTYSREFAREVREAAKLYGVEALITDDYLEVEARIADLHVELVLGTQMERHIAKRLKLPCAVISAPVHVQDFPARFSPQMGFEGANVLFDSWVHPLMMGLEEHLLTMFRDDFEFHEGAAASHLSHAGALPTARVSASVAAAATVPAAITAAPQSELSVSAVAAPAARQDRAPATPAHGVDTVEIATADRTEVAAAHWAPDAQRELQKIPFFVRGKARRNTERFAADRGLATITVDTLYDAKAYFGR